MNKEEIKQQAEQLAFKIANNENFAQVVKVLMDMADWQTQQIRGFLRCQQMNLFTSDYPGKSAEIHAIERVISRIDGRNIAGCEKAMTEESFEECRKMLRSRYEKDVYALEKMFAEQGNPYEVGDIIKDHIGKGKILEWSMYRTMNGFPRLVYRCQNLTSKGTVNKREPTRLIYQENIKKS